MIRQAKTPILSMNPPPLTEEALRHHVTSYQLTAEDNDEDVRIERIQEAARKLGFELAKETLVQEPRDVHSWVRKQSRWYSAL